MGLGKVYKKPTFFLVVLPFLMAAAVVCGMTSCGIEDEPYLSPVSPGVAVTSNTSARIGGMSVAGESDYSPNYLLYYKIYISGMSVTSAISPDAMSGINSTLDSDYRGILPYTTLNTSTIQVFTPTVFSNRNFYPIRIGDSETLSSSTSSITINFLESTLPSLSPNGNAAQTLSRSTSNGSGTGSFTPLPENDRSFRNFSELRNAQNKDVAQGGGGAYSYCAVYIIKRGINRDTLSAIYSAPTFVAVFRLPDRY